MTDTPGVVEAGDYPGEFSALALVIGLRDRMVVHANVPEVAELLALVERAGFGYAQLRSVPRTSMVDAVRADLAGMRERTGGVVGSFRAMALYVAEAIDAHAASANPATTGKLIQELRTVLEAVARRDTEGDDESDRLAAELGTPSMG